MDRSRAGTDADEHASLLVQLSLEEFRFENDKSLRPETATQIFQVQTEEDADESDRDREIVPEIEHQMATTRTVCFYSATTIVIIIRQMFIMLSN